MHQKKLLLIKKYDMREKQQSWLFLIYVKWRIAYTQDDLFQFICIHSNSTYTSATHAAYIQYSKHMYTAPAPKSNSIGSNIHCVGIHSYTIQKLQHPQFFYDFECLQIKVLKASI